MFLAIVSKSGYPNQPSPSIAAARAQTQFATVNLTSISSEVDLPKKPQQPKSPIFHASSSSIQEFSSESMKNVEEI